MQFDLRSVPAMIPLVSVSIRLQQGSRGEAEQQQQELLPQKRSLCYKTCICRGGRQDENGFPNGP